jgi:hypothetical protein
VSRGVPLAERLRRPQTAAVAVSYVAAAAVLLVGAALPSSRLLTAGLLVSYLLDHRMLVSEKALDSALGRVALGASVRFILRELAVVSYLFRSNVDDAVVVAVMVAVWALHGVRGAAGAFAAKVRKLRRLPALTRNVDLSALGIPDAPSPLVMRYLARKLLHLDVLLVVGGVVTGSTGAGWPVLAGAAVGVAGGVAATAYLATQWRANRHLGDRERILAAINDEVRADRPEVLLYFSGSTMSTYQVNMWLDTVAALPRPALVVLRERANMPLLGRTAMPVVCIPSAVDLMALSLPDLRVALFVANVGANIHVLRIPGVGMVFVGHGDSDKTASFNPYSKVYDEVWVAGPAGRERYARAQVGVRDEEIVEVGRPQLAGVAAIGPRPPGWVPTVIYAPTWEGWTDELPQTSLMTMGRRVVEALLAHEPPVRVIFKPHPLTGTRLRAARVARDEIVELLVAANTALDGGGARPAGDAASRRTAQAAVTALAEELGQARWRKPSPRADEAETARELGRIMPETLAAAAEAEIEFERAYWAAEPQWRHRVVTQQRPSLYSCFNESDLLVADISSVVSDYLASGKPYVVTNTGDEPEDAYRAANSAAVAAYLLDSRSDVGQVVATALDGDPLRAARRAAAAHLLGERPQEAQQRFAAAVDALAARYTTRVGTVTAEPDDAEEMAGGTWDQDTAAPADGIEQVEGQAHV